MNRKIILILSGIFIFFCSALSYAENNLVLIVDSSHFMKSLSSGTSKTKLAGEALIQFIDSLVVEEIELDSPGKRDVKTIFTKFP